MNGKLKRAAALLLAAFMLAGLMTMQRGVAMAEETMSQEPERVSVKADYEGAWVKFKNHLLKLFLPEGWELADNLEGALMAAIDPATGLGLTVEELILPGVTLEGVMEAFRADSGMRNVREVYINDLRLVRYESADSGVLGFVSLTGYSDRVLLFKYELASDTASNEMAAKVMSTLTRMAKASTPKPQPTDKPVVVPQPTAKPVNGIQTWAELLKAAKAGKTLVTIGADLKRGAKQGTAVFKSAVKIKSADGVQYVIDGNGKQAIRVEKADGSKVSGTTEIEGLKFVNGDAGVFNEVSQEDGMGGAVYVNGDLKVTDSAFENNKADLGGAIAAIGDLTLENTDIVGNTAIGIGGGVYAGGTSVSPVEASPGTRRRKVLAAACIPAVEISL